jgi:AcrR family transcriptional regulator
MPGEHPTRTALIATTVSLMDTRPLDEIRSEDVLEISGISKGSLYHHFNDFSELLNAALVLRFSMWVDRSIELLTHILESSTTKDEIFEGLERVTDITQGPEGLPRRYERARVLALAENNPMLARELGDEQARLTNALADLTREAIRRGFYRADLDPVSVALFIQAYSFGKVIDDISSEKVDFLNWKPFISGMLRRTLEA